MAKANPKKLRNFVEKHLQLKSRGVAAVTALIDYDGDLAMIVDFVKPAKGLFGGKFKPKDEPEEVYQHMSGRQAKQLHKKLHRFLEDKKVSYDPNAVGQNMTTFMLRSGVTVFGADTFDAEKVPDKLKGYKKEDPELYFKKGGTIIFIEQDDPSVDPGVLDKGFKRTKTTGKKTGFDAAAEKIQKGFGSLYDKGSDIASDAKEMMTNEDKIRRMIRESLRRQLKK
tara:strand:- start:220 stop:894 length:675 start_codon:yes stop_codon:yes gene_type:complete